MVLNPQFDAVDLDERVSTADKDARYSWLVLVLSKPGSDPSWFSSLASSLAAPPVSLPSHPARLSNFYRYGTKPLWGASPAVFQVQ